jgi:hypothetical protein
MTSEEEMCCVRWKDRREETRLVQKAGVGQAIGDERARVAENTRDCVWENAMVGPVGTEPWKVA